MRKTIGILITCVICFGISGAALADTDWDEYFAGADTLDALEELENQAYDLDSIEDYDAFYEALEQALNKAMGIEEETETQGMIIMDDTASDVETVQNTPSGETKQNVITSSNFDLTSLSLDELVSLRNATLAEILSRLGEDEPFASGVYVVGKDIKAGSYTITNLNTESTYVYQIADLAVLPEGSSVNDETPNPLYTGRINAQASFNVNLEDGMTLVIDLGEGALAIRSTEATSWRP